jgi:hypothetical protein
MFGEGYDGSEWDCSMYRQAGVEFSDRWNKWACVRDDAKEDAVYQTVTSGIDALSPLEFWHDDPSRGLNIHLPGYSSYSSKSFYVKAAHHSGLTPVLFHWRKLLEMCDVIHCIPSSFAAFVDSIPLPKNPKLYLYSDARPGEPLMQVNKSWHIWK